VRGFGRKGGGKDGFGGRRAHCAVPMHPTKICQIELGEESCVL
jgi:hypothetical protein